MNVVWSVVPIAVGALVVLLTLLSAIRTVVLPHGRTANLTHVMFMAVRRILDIHRKLPRMSKRRHEVMSLYAPLTLVCLPLVWLSGALAGFTMIFWGLGTTPWRAAFKLAGSSMLTIGFSNVDDLPRMAVSFFAAALAISILALLLVTYLPTMYQAYSSREVIITALETFAGSPPDPVVMLRRYAFIGAVDQLDDIWKQWRDWFFEARDTHTALPAVVYFRSSAENREWVPSVAALLDAAALWNAVCTTEQDAHASLCLRAGSLALNDIAESFGLEFVTDPSPDDPISVDRAHFDEMYAALDEIGLAVVRDVDAAWSAWAGWRVNYDIAAAGLTVLTELSG